MEKKNALSLDLNETLFFKPSYEIDEMMSISIDPEISIQSFNDYVSIRGVVELEGEYIRALENSKISDGNIKQIDKVFARTTEKADGTVYFNHHFPVDISIPLNRVRSLEDVTVSVKAFDYALTKPNKLQIISSLYINGVYREKQKTKLKDEQSPATTNVEFDDTIQFKVIERATRKEGKQSVNAADHKEEKSLNHEQDELARDSQEKIETKFPKKKASHDNKNDTIIDDERDRGLEVTDIKTKEPITIIDKDDKGATDLIESIAQFDKDSAQIPRKEVEKQRDSQILESVDKISDTTEGIKVAEQPNIEQESSTDQEQLQDITYLADIFESSEEIEPYQMRLCIVQKDDTLHSIAERYEIPTQQIVHLNKLDDEQVLDGQLLLIPTENH